MGPAPGITCLQSSLEEDTVAQRIEQSIGLQDIKDGKITAGLGLDVPLQEWLQVDAAARLMLGEKIPPSEGDVRLRFLAKKDITFDPSRGNSGYPEFAERFTKLWAGK
jgi:ribose transport system substrate-binding protein